MRVSPGMSDSFDLGWRPVAMSNVVFERLSQGLSHDLSSHIFRNGKNDI